jgi:hypothetical protein
MPIKHAFTSGKGAAGDTTLVDGDNWDADHNAPPFVVPLVSQANSPLSWAVPSALTELGGNSRARTIVNLTYCSQARIVVNITDAASASAKLRLQYSTNSGSSWNYLDDTSGPSVGINAASVAASAWVNLATNAKAEVWIRVVGIDGDGSDSATIAQVSMQVK